ncbi:MAG: RNA degradosome polyphosphate kinase, partial [Gammaproteobacteria bacterium]|nr:RNA degradosome polyphosphate kinase [Gammaproteobacteria bacterium]
VVGYKTHAKMLMIVRREPEGLRRYVHLGTGNYHAKTARLYTDYSLFTADPEIGEDVHRIFMQLTSLGRATTLGKLLQAPFSLLPTLLTLIEREADNARQGRPARIVAKMNALIERKVIEALYAASAAGVQIDLIVRGVCALRPGLPGVSENIRVRSIVGRFLEHTRVFYFENGGQPRLFGASADWMDRNLYRRVETCFPIEEPTLKQRVVDELMIYLRDNMQAWELGADGTYTRVQHEQAPALSAQAWLLERLAENPLPGGGDD